MWQQNVSIWSDRDYMDQQDYFSRKNDEFVERKFTRELKILIHNEFPPNDIEECCEDRRPKKYEDRRGI